jgi:hypothetical protein
MRIEEPPAFPHLKRGWATERPVILMLAFGQRSTLNSRDE